MQKKINKLERLLYREKIAKEICAELNNFVDLRPSLIIVLNHIKKLSECEAVSIRLYDDGDYPYYVHNGFPGLFIKKENSLCSRDERGDRIPSPDGNGYLLDCMCGNIIKGEFDSSLPFFTEKGSFWSNNTSALLASTSEEERQGRTRNFCNSCGYESVALIPIITKGERMGLIQLNDKRIGIFTEDLIMYFEMIGENIGIAIQNSLVHTKLKNAYEEIKTLKGLIPICASCKNIRDDKGFWENVENYISKHSEAEFTHSICPECVKELYPDIYIRKCFKDEEKNAIKVINND